MATVTANFTNSNTITITIASLTNGSTNTSSAIDNSTNKFLEALVQVKVKSAAAGTSASGYCNVWFIRSADGGTTYDDSGRVLLGTFPVVANATTYTTTFTTQGLGGLGTSWKIALENQSGATLDATAGNHLAQFAGIKYDVA